MCINMRVNIKKDFVFDVLNQHNTIDIRIVCFFVFF